MRACRRLPANLLRTERPLSARPTSGPLYELAGDHQFVELRAQFRLPLSPVGVQRMAKDELATAARQLVAPLGRMLRATLATNDRASFDAENILFYNVGPAAFGGCTQDGVAFSLTGLSSESGFRYVHRYDIVPMAPHPSGQPSLSFQVPKLNSATSVDSIWWAAHCGLRTPSLPVTGPFRLSLSLSGSRPTPSLAVVMKPLVDGVVAALHSSPSADPACISLLAKRLGRSEGEVDDALQRTACTPLGPQRLLHAFRGFVKWNPADDRCIECSLQWTEGHQGIGTTIDVFLEPVPGPAGSLGFGRV